MMNFHTKSDLTPMRRYYALTQHDTEIESMLIENCNMCQGKAVGFVKTREWVLHNQFDNEALEEFLQFVDSGQFKNDSKISVLYSHMLLESVFKDFVHVDMVDSFVEWAKMKIAEHHGNLIDAKKEIKDYFNQMLKDGRVLSTGQIYKNVLRQIPDACIIEL